MDEILNALVRLRVAFQREGMKPPLSLELGSHEDIRRFAELAKGYWPTTFEPSMDFGQPEIIGRVLDITIRGPARWRALEGGGFVAE